MMGHGEKTNGNEHDAFGGWKRLLCVFKKPGVSAKIKARFNRRMRKDAKLATRRSFADQ